MANVQSKPQQPQQQKKGQPQANKGQAQQSQPKNKTGKHGHSCC